jgi:hypothetical protein
VRYLTAALVTLALATAMHFDWHAARPVVHHLSLGWSAHWLLAVPVFAVTAWHVHQAWPSQPGLASAVIIAVAALLAGVVEPAWELWVAGASLDWTFGRLRLTALFLFLAVGGATHAIVLVILGMREELARAKGPASRMGARRPNA